MACNGKSVSLFSVIRLSNPATQLSPKLLKVVAIKFFTRKPNKLELTADAMGKPELPLNRADA